MIPLVFACSRPLPPRKLTPKDVKRAIQQAHNVCHNSEDTPACRVMWDRVDELSHALARQEEKEKEEELEKREYDV